MLEDLNKNPHNLLFLDGLRGLAAFYVMVGHARWLLWEGFNEGYINHPEAYSRSNKFFVYFLSIFRYGHEAVILFFILSGFVIHLRYSKAILEQGANVNFDYKSYFVRRIKRIYPPLLLSILLTFILDQWGMHMKYSIYFEETPYSSINDNIQPNHSVMTLTGNLLFLMHFFFKTFGTNGPYWSLAYEWWFYCLYPLFFYVAKKRIGLATLLLVVMYLTLLVLDIEFLIFFKLLFSGMVLWWMGVLMADIYTQRIKIKFEYLCPLLVFLIIMPIRLWNHFLYPFQNIFWGLGFVGLFSVFFTLKKKGIRILYFEKLKGLGDISYSLYIIHMPILVLLSGFVLSRNNNALPTHFFYVLIGIIISILAAIPLHFVAERPFISKKR